MWGNGCTHYPLTQQWVKLSVLLRRNVSNDCALNQSQKWCFILFVYSYFCYAELTVLFGGGIQVTHDKVHLYSHFSWGTLANKLNATVKCFELLASLLQYQSDTPLFISSPINCAPCELTLKERLAHLVFWGHAERPDGVIVCIDARRHGFWTHVKHLQLAALLHTPNHHTLCPVL